MAIDEDKDEEIEEIGVITSYFSKIGVGAIKIKKKLKVGDTIGIRGATTNFDQKVESMQLNHKNITEAKKDDEIGIKLSDKVRKNDKVFLVE